MDEKSGTGLLIRCLREEDAVAKIERLGTLTGPEWEAVYRVSLHFGLTPLLYSTLRSFRKDIRLPADIERRLREVYLNSTARNMRLYSELSKVLKILTDAGIPVIPLKGAYLAEVVYRDRALRPMNDIDLMVRQDDFRKTIELFTDKGYRVEGKAVVPEDVFSVQQHYPPLTGKNGLSIEVHWTLTQPDLNDRIEIKSIWHRTRPCMVANVDVLVLSPEDLILHLCIHAALHHGLGGQLRSLFDISRTIRFYTDDINWRFLSDLARLWGAERSVYLVLALAGRYAGIPVPEDFMADIRPENSVSEIFEIAETFLFNRSPIAIPRRVARLWEEKDFLRKCRYLLSRFFLPRIEIAVHYGVPSDSIKVYLYYFVRWRDIFRRHLRNVVRALWGKEEMKENLEISIKQNVLLNWLRDEKR
jgi:hypothetical protein